MIRGVRSGPHTICALPLTGDMIDPNASYELVKRADQLFVHCVPYTVTDAAEQMTTVVIP